MTINPSATATYSIETISDRSSEYQATHYPPQTYSYNYKTPSKNHDHSLHPQSYCSSMHSADAETQSPHWVDTPSTPCGIAHIAVSGRHLHHHRQLPDTAHRTLIF
jgi:hypothetical protein